MTISAIIPTFNRPETTIRALKSVLSQTRPCSEVIVVDDASTDHTAETLKSFKEQHKTSDLKIIHLKENQGVSGARNAGIKTSTSNWLAFLDSDDEWRPKKLELQMASLEKSKLLISHTDEDWVRDNKKVNKKKQHKKYGGSVYKECLDMCFIGPSTSIIHKDIFEDLGLFDEELTVCEDYDLWLRITSKYEVDFVDQVLMTKYGGHEDQLSTSFKAMDYWRLLALKKQLNNQTLSKELKVLTQNKFDEKKELLILGCVKHQNTELLNKINQL
jgi:glycosyltransferase involved in cell wall biosynthesis